MKVLELFAGSKSIGKVAEKYGCEVFSVDIHDFKGIDLVVDILDMVRSDIPFVPDFIWASPPCPTHSVTNHFLNAQGVKRYPDMNLYQEIILLQTFFKGKYVIENVKSYYEPLIKPQVSGRHYFWANFTIPKLKYEKQIGRMNGKKNNLNGKAKAVLRQNNLDKLGFNLDKYDYSDKDKLLRNCVPPIIGKAIFDSALGIYQANNIKQVGLFEEGLI